MLGWTDGLKMVAFGTAICVAPVIVSSPAAAARSHEHVSAVHAAASHGGAFHAAFEPKQKSGSKQEWSMRVVTSRGTTEFTGRGGREFTGRTGREFTGRAGREFGGRHGGAMLREAFFTRFSGKHFFSKNGKARYAMRGGYSYEGGYGGLQCVPFARAASGIELKGNAADWWYAAAGVYDRGSRPEPGSVLNFRSIGRMRLGHVAVVSAVINSRQIEVDHANWAGSYGGVSRGVAVVDVSPNNDWSEVRVAMGHSGELGSGVYPTYGFIYDRPDTGMMASNARGHRAAPAQSYDEVAEAPARPRVIIPAGYSQ